MAVNPNPNLPTWPSQFGCAQMEPRLGVIDPVVRTDMDIGFKSRQRYLNPILRGTYTVVLTNAQYLLFQGWHKHVLNNGSLWFNFQVRAGNTMSWEEVMMTDIYEPEEVANRFTRVRFSIVQRTDSIPSAAEVASALS